MIATDSNTDYRDNGGALPAPLYESVVRALYDDLKALFVGKLAVILTMLVIAYRTEDPVYWGFLGLVTAISLVRVLIQVRFSHVSKGELTQQQLKAWDKRYALWGSVFVAVLGVFCLTTFARSNDDIVHLYAIAMTMAYLIGISGRNFASERIVSLQVFCSGVPILTGLFLFGNNYHAFLALMLIPFFGAMYSISKRLRRMLFGAVMTALDNKTIVDRFNVALANVSHGMAMFDGEGKVVVSNARFAPLAGLPDDFDMTDIGFDELGQGEAKSQAVPKGEKLLSDSLRECMRKRRNARFHHVLADGTVVEVKFHPMEHDGGVVVIEDITERVSNEEEIRKLASFDPLTNLPNRRFFMSEVNRLLGGKDGLEPCTVFFVDLDNFKDVNDSLGHAIGDKLLCSIALRLRSRMPDNGMACRFGGDEFVIVIPGKMSRNDCQKLAAGLIEEISKTVVIDGHSLTIGASIGISQAPANGRDYNSLLKVSDVALYDAKARGRGGYSFYSDELGDVVRDRRALENDLRHAVKNGALQVHYQPLIDLHRNRIKAFEALVRWNHPEKGMIPPGTFIPIAEEIGVITQIGQFVLEEATRQCLLWPEHISVAVNVSSLQFQQSDVCAVVNRALAKSGLSPSRLEIEVTESAMLENIGETTTTLAKLSEVGVRISLDDFGTGFSSLSYLNALPLDKVKIDRSFIEDIRTDERSLVLLTGVTHLARDLGLTITVEGIETEEQRDILIERVHVDEMQGYLFGRAMPAGDVLDLVGSAGIENREYRSAAG